MNKDKIAMNDTTIVFVCPDYKGSDVFKSASLPVGLGYLVRSLEINGIGSDVVDLNVYSVDYLFSKLRDVCPAFLGISMMSYRCKITYDLLYDMKAIFPKMHIIAGGPHVTANRQKVLKECTAIDIGVVGEGELALIELINGASPASVLGTLYREGDDVKFAGERKFILDLDEVPFPTYRGFKLEMYGERMQLASSRGCPYRCIYCGAPKILGKKWRKRTAQGMLAEFDYWYDRCWRSFYFNDSNFAIDKKRVKTFCEEIIKRDINVSFVADGVRADHVDYELLKLMQRAGFTSITFGVESGSNSVLRNLKKGETCEQIESAIAAATNLDFNVTLFFLIGSPGESEEDVKKSFTLALKYNLANVYFFNLTPLPGTEFYDWAVEHGFLDGGNNFYPEDNFGFSSKALFQTDAMTLDQITGCLKKARHIERQVRAIFYLQKFLRLITRKNTKLNRNRRGWFLTLTWFLSFRRVMPIYTSLGRFAKILLGNLVAK